MGWLAFVALALVVGAFLILRKKPERTRNDESRQRLPERATQPASDPRAAQLAGHVELLKAKWTAAEEDRDAGKPSSVPSWFFDPPTERQLERLSRDGLAVRGEGLTKGAASDLIGLSEPVEDGDAEVLRFFKVPLKDMNQTLARYEVARLIADPANMSAWEGRPADAMQKECLRFYGVAVPRGLTVTAAAALITEKEADLEAQGSKLAEEWSSFERLVDELSDRETCEDYGIKKPTLAMIRAAVEELRKGGKSLDELETEPELVTDKIIEMRPEMERA